MTKTTVGIVGDEISDLDNLQVTGAVAMITSIYDATSIHHDHFY
jgi:hypothetical protein